MRILHFWWRTFIISRQYNSPRFIELLMLSLAMIMLVVAGGTDKWPYLALGLSYVVGASISILVRETFLPSHQQRLTQFTAVLLLIISLYGFVDLARFF